MKRAFVAIGAMGDIGTLRHSSRRTI